MNLDKFYREFEQEPVRRHMESRGFYIFKGQLEPDSLAGLRAQINELSSEPDTEVNYAGSEHRIWHAERRGPAFAELEELSNWVMPQLYGRPSAAHTVLAIRNRPVPDEAERMDTRWHIDSFQRQLKLFAFLTDVAPDNGPLEFVPGTHKPFFKWSRAIPLGYYRAQDLLKWRSGKRSWQHIHNKTIEDLRKSGYKSEELTVPAGSIALVDTSALHRAKPLVSGERYAVTVYHR